MTAPAPAAAATAAASAQAVQAGLATALGLGLQQAWQALNVNDLRGSLPRYGQLVAALIHRYGLASATLAVRQYAAERAAAGVSRPFTAIPAAPASLTQIGQSVDWATQGLWSTEPDVPAVQQLVQGVAEKLTLQPGRDTIIGNVHRDPAAKGWARVPEPGCCSFCALLATRGVAYRSERAADFKSHDNCRCHAEPVFTAYEPSAQVREWQALYADSAGRVNGMHAKQLAFRRAFEGRSA